MKLRIASPQAIVDLRNIDDSKASVKPTTAA